MYGVLGEDKSDFQTLKILVQRLADKKKVDIRGKGYTGCGELLKKGGEDLKLLSDMGCTRFIIAHDADQRDSKEVGQMVRDKITAASAKFSTSFAPSTANSYAAARRSKRRMDAATTLPAGAAELTLGLLNVATQAWVEQEYRRAKHFNPLTDVTRHRFRAVVGRPSGCQLRPVPPRKPKRPEGRPTDDCCVTSALKLIYNAMARLMLEQA